LLAAAAPEARAAARRTAIVVGNNDGGATRTALRYAGRDALRVSEVVTTLAGVAPHRVFLLLDGDADDLRTVFAKTEALAASGDPSALLFFYYSGHADRTGLLMGETRYPFAELRERLGGSSAQTVVSLVDACQSGEMVRPKGGRTVPVVETDFESDRSYAGRVYIASSAPGEISQESDELQASFFTHALVAGLRGLADESGDGQVTLDELYGYVYHHTLARTVAPGVATQHPTHDFDVAGRGELVLTRLADDGTHLLFPAELKGRLFVQASSGEFVAEFPVTGKRPHRLSVAPGRYRVGQRIDDRLLVQEITARPGRATPLDPDGMREVSTSDATLASKGRPGAAGVISAEYRLRTGYLEQAGVVHGGAIGYRRPFGAVDLGLSAGAGTSRFTRSDGIEVELLELSLAALAQLPVWRTDRTRAALAADVALGWIRERGTLTVQAKPGSPTSVELASAAVFYGGGLDLGLRVAPDLWLGVGVRAGQVRFPGGAGEPVSPWTFTLAAGPSYEVR